MRTIGVLVEILRKKPYPEKLGAIEELKNIRTPEAASVLITGLYDPDSRIRSKVCEALAAMGEIAITPLTTALKTPDRQVRRHICQVLCGIVENYPAVQERVEGLLISCLKDPDPVVKTQACEKLDALKSKRAIPHIIPLLSDINSWVRSVACLVLGDLGLEDVEPLFERLEDIDHWVRRSACEALGKLGCKRAAEKLATLSLFDDSEIVRDAAVDALKAIGEIVVEPYKKALTSPNLSERLQAIDILQREGNIVVLPMIELLKSPEEELKMVACQILETIGDIRALEPLISLLGEARTNVRMQAINAIAKMREEKAVRLLISLLSHPDSNLADGASSCLEKMGEFAVPFLLEGKNNEDARVRMKICQILGNIASNKAIDSLTKSLRDESPWVRAAACEALGKIGERGIIPYIIIALKDNNYLVRAKACETLGRIRTPLAVGELIARLSDEDLLVKREALKALTTIGASFEAEGLLPKIKTAIISALKDTDVEVRVAAINSLSQLELIDTIDILEKIARPWPFSREDALVKSEARKVIKRFKAIIAYQRAHIK